jgi:gliding motility-associated-like protein
LTATKSGCTATDQLQVTVFPSPTANVVTADTTIQSGASVQLTGVGIGQANWSPATGLSCTNCLNPVATPTETTTYTLTIYNADSCSATETVTITVLPPDCSLQVPNAFTPNDDTLNDVFKPIGPSIQSFELRVYNRWGQEVYSGTQAWNGKHDNQEAPSDVYVYRVRAQVCGVEREVSGGVSLLR